MSYLRDSWLPAMRTRIFIDGELQYPQVANGNNVEPLLEAMASAMTAVNLGNFRELPDWKGGYLMNCDGICRSCGNLVELRYSGGVICDLVRRENRYEATNWFKLFGSCRTEINENKNKILTNCDQIPRYILESRLDSKLLDFERRTNRKWLK